MTRRIFLYSFLIGLAVLVLCTTMFLTALYRYYETQVYDELQVEAELLAHGMELSGEEYLNTLQMEERITWISRDGTVLYDDTAVSGEMENHLDRPEIQQAIKDGSGRSSRESETLMGRTLYYAMQLDDGTILRISCTQNTVMEMLQRMVGPIVWVVLLALLMSAFFSYQMARKITAPISAIEVDRPAPDHAYKELQPLVTRLMQQNDTIRRQVDELGLRQREFSAITENMSEGFLLVDAKTNILSSNHSAMRILGGRPPVDNLRRSECRREICSVVETALAGVRAEEVVAFEDGSWQVIANPVIAHGQVAGAVVIVMDVTEREQREALRREFSANVSHELKTPLTSISGFAELMRDGMVPMEKVQEFAGDIYSESRRLIDLVEDIIRLSRLDENNGAFDTETVDLYDLADEILANLQPVADRSSVQLQLEGIHATVDGVWQILHEVVYNLCDNAIKYNKPGGSVTVHVIVTDGQVRLSVEDTGIGIPYADQSRVFERFYRVDKSHSRAIGGTGLGLSIVKHGVQYHNARLELRSTPGQGTEITIIF